MTLMLLSATDEEMRHDKHHSSRVNMMNSISQMEPWMGIDVLSSPPASYFKSSILHSVFSTILRLGSMIDSSRCL